MSGLDLHTPGVNNLPRLPNLSLVPGNVSGGLNLMQQNNYNIGNNSSPNNDFCYPHLTFPNNHYDCSPSIVLLLRNKVFGAISSIKKSAIKGLGSSTCKLLGSWFSFSVVLAQIASKGV